MTRVRISSAVHSVLNAAASSSQNRWRLVRTYQLVTTSRCTRTASHAPGTSNSSSWAVTPATRSRVRASRYRSIVASPATSSAATRRAARPAPPLAAPA